MTPGLGSQLQVLILTAGSAIIEIALTASTALVTAKQLLQLKSGPNLRNTRLQQLSPGSLQDLQSSRPMFQCQQLVGKE